MVEVGEEKVNWCSGGKVPVAEAAPADGGGEAEALALQKEDRDVQRGDRSGVRS